MSKEDDTLLKCFSIKASEGYVDYINDRIHLIMNSKDLSRSEAFEYLSKIIANALNKDGDLKRYEDEHGIDLHMSDEDAWKPSPPRW